MWVHCNSQSCWSDWRIRHLMKTEPNPKKKCPWSDNRETNSPCSNTAIWASLMRNCQISKSYLKKGVSFELWMRSCHRATYAMTRAGSTAAEMHLIPEPKAGRIFLMQCGLHNVSPSSAEYIKTSRLDQSTIAIMNPTTYRCSYRAHLKIQNRKHITFLVVALLCA